MPVTEAQKRARYKYEKEKLKRVPLDLKKEEYEQLKAYTERTGESVNGLIRRLIRNEIERGSGADASG